MSDEVHTDEDILDAEDTLFGGSTGLPGGGRPLSAEGLTHGARVLSRRWRSAAGDPAGTARGLDASMEEANKRQEGIDYWNGVRDAGFRAAYSRMDTPEEREAWLTANVGENTEEAQYWGVDKFGQYALTPAGMDKMGFPHKGMPVAIDEHSPTRYDLADAAGDAPAVIGGVGGGMMASGYGFLPGTALAATGAGLGKAIDEGVEYFQGYQRQSPGEIAQDVAATAGYEALGESAGRALRPVGRWLLGPNTTRDPAPSPTLGSGLQKQPPVRSTIPPDRLKAAQEVIEAGGRPSVGTATRKRLPTIFEKIAWAIFGDPVEAQNRQAILDGIGRLEADAAGGAPTGVGPRQAGEMVEGQVLGRTGTLAQRADETSKRAIQYQEDAAKQLSGRAPKFLEGLGDETIDLLAASREQFAISASARYGRFDELIGGEAVVPTQQLKNAARLIASRVPPTKSGKPSVFQSTETRTFMDGVNDLPDYITAQQMQAVRTTLREAAYDPNILVGVSKKHAGDMKAAADRAFGEVGEEQIRNLQGQFVSAGRSQAELKEAIEYLGQTTKWYAEGISKYDNTFILKLTRDAGKGGVEPDKVVDYIIQPKKRAALRAVKDLLPPEQWEKIADEHFQRMLEQSRGIDELVDGGKLHNAVKKMGFTLDEVYGPTRAGQIRRFAQEAAAKNGKYPIDDLVDSPMKDALLAMKAADEELAAWSAIPFVKRFSADVFDPEKEARVLLSPNSSRDVAKVRDFLGENSPEWAAVRENSMGLLLDKTSTILEDPVLKVFLGKNLRDAVDKIGDDTLVAMFGRQTTDDLQKFARVAHFMTSKPKGASGSLIAAAIAVHPIANLGTMAKFLVMRKWFAGGGLRHMTTGFDAPGTRWTADNVTRVLNAMMAQSQQGPLDLWNSLKIREPRPVEGDPLTMPMPEPESKKPPGVSGPFLPGSQM